MLQTMHSTAHQHGLAMLHTTPSTPGSCSSASSSSAASTASSASAGSEGSTHHQLHHPHHSRRPSTSSSMNTVTTGTSASTGDHRHMHGSADIGTATGAAAVRRLRTIRLTRPCVSGSSRRAALQLGAASIGLQASTFGFAVRGGREFGIGFFVSRIDRGGEADVRGLRVGDQLMRVNGYAVDDAVHRELSQYVSCQDRLTLKVRGVGMLPVKDRQSDALSWHAVPGAINPAIPAANPRRCGPDEFQCQDVRITLDVEPRTKLGLGICKGPEWKPGIFVQFTKDVSVARDAGLRPGDQLLSCNGVDFADVLFSEAVAVMKASQHLEMVVRTAAGVDLFPGESSGYNSSASSVTGGDQSPCWGDQASKRLSMVREEDAVEKINTQHNKHWERTDHDRRPDRRLHSVQPPVVPPNYRPSAKSTAAPPAPAQPATALASATTPDSRTNTTIIKLSETGTIINNTMVPLIADKSRRSSSVQSDVQRNGNPADRSSQVRVNGSETNAHGARLTGDGGQQQQVADIRFVSRKIETKTVTVEVHRDTDEAPVEKISAKSPVAPAKNGASGGGSTAMPPPPPPPPSMMGMRSVTPAQSEDGGAHSSLMSGPMSDAASLSSAISEELKKRAERGMYEVNPSRPASASSSSNTCGALQPGRIVLKKVRSTFGAAGPNSEDKHNALIDEFKLAHRKMFRNASNADETPKSTPATADASVDQERQLELRGCQQQAGPNKPASGRFDQTTASYPDSPSPDYDDHQRPANGVLPPPPAKQSPATVSAVKPAATTNGGTMGRCAAHEMAKATGDAAELESIDSYKLTNPASPPPKPPSSYFQSAGTGPATLKKPVRSVAVTIGEYGGARKEAPRQFDFIGTGGAGGRDAVDSNGNGGDVSHRLKNELESTLSRSNLKSRTEGPTNASATATRLNAQPPPTTRPVSLPGIAPTLNGGQLFGPNANGAAGGRPSLHKTQSNVEKITAMLVSQNLMGSRPTTASAALSPVNVAPPAPPPPVNGINAVSNGGTRVTINVGNGNGGGSSTTIGGASPPMPSGILKNGHNGGSPLSTSASATSLEQRNITFGNITTVLTDNL